MKRKNPKHLVPYYMLTASFLFVLLPVLGGCGNAYTRQYNNLGLAEVKGIVTLDGQPLPNALVHFEHENKTYSYGETNKHGEYQLHFDSHKTGVLPGSKIVRIWTTRQNSDSDSEQETQGNPVQERIPSQYNQKSTLTVVVEAGKTQTFNFDLKSGK
ncbi:MAG: hypothetical protein LBC20_08970 [Planctomycetaceae bacterium]|jgi:hypothetical protein|nr:hypothetical protein [Planctomycetaceae bacterium]